MCAVRAGVPLVEDGSAALDPYEPWLAARVDSAAVFVATCEAACDASLGELRREILRLCPPTLVAAGILTQTACRI
jgi:hypothetical protein